MNKTTYELPKKVNGTLAYWATQCTCPNTGETGDFLFTGETWRNVDSRVSPVMDIVDLYKWLAANGWEQVKGTSMANKTFIKRRQIAEDLCTHLLRSA